MRRFARGFGILVKHHVRLGGEYDGGRTLREARLTAEAFASAPEVRHHAYAEVWIVRFSADGERRYLIERVYSDDDGLPPGAPPQGERVATENEREPDGDAEDDAAEVAS